MRANLVGRSVVSAITQTPASGPFDPLTTPPMSSASIATCGAALLCWAAAGAAVPVRYSAKAAAAKALAATPDCNLLVVFIPSSLLVSPDVTTGRSAGGEFDNSLV